MHNLTVYKQLPKLTAVNLAVFWRLVKLAYFITALHLQKAWSCK